MTANQQQAIGLANALIAAELEPSDLTDDQWALLLLAGGASNHRLPPRTFARRVRSQFDNQLGYFGGVSAMLPPAEEEQPLKLG